MISRIAAWLIFSGKCKLNFLIVDSGYNFIIFGEWRVKLYLCLNNNKAVSQPHGFWGVYEFGIKEIVPPEK